MKILTFCVAVCLSVALAASDVRADNIVIAADIWCPANCEPDAELPGYVVEIAKEVFAAEGHTVEYRVIPWERAIQLGKEGKINAIISAYKVEAPEFIFPENEQLFVGDTFFTLKESTWRYKGVDSLKKIRLGVISGYDYSKEINEYIQQSTDKDKVQVGFGDYPLKRNIQKLQMGRVDVVLETDLVFWYLAKQMGVADKFKKADENIPPKKAYLAFSPADKKSHEYVKILSEGMDELRASGRLVKILAKYGLKDWK